MDSQDYLNQISAMARPVKAPKKGLMGVLTSKYFKWGMVALGLFIVMAIFGAILGGRVTPEQQLTNLKLRFDRTVEVIDTYQSQIKSSQLRSLSGSLKGILSNTSTQLNNYMINAYQFDAGKIKEAVVEESNLQRDELVNELFNAKINGLLDRTYAHKMTLEIYTTMGEEAGIANDSSDATLKELLTSSYDSLNNLYAQFNDFSETK